MKWKLKILKNRAQFHHPLILAGNKADCAKRYISQKRAKKWTKDFFIDTSVPYIEISAKTGMNVLKFF